MQNLATDEAGNVWELDAQGNPVRVVQPAASGRVFSLPQSPEKIKEEARKDRDQQLQEESADRAERAADRADKTAQRQAAAAEKTASAASKPTEFQSKSAGFLKRMLGAEQAFNSVPDGERGSRSVPREAFHKIAPGLENTFINSSDRQKADQAIENFIAASLRQESGASISPAEFTRQYNIFFPSPGNTPEVIAQKAEARRQAIEGFRVAAGPLADVIAGKADQQADNEVPDPTTGAATKPDPADGSPPEYPPANDPQTSAAQGASRTEFSPRLSSMVDSMVNAGASLASINAALTGKGQRPITAQSYADAKKWMKANPGQRYYGSNITKEAPLSLWEKAAGSAVGSGAARYANAATAGMVGALAGDKGQGALDAMAAAHPDASVVGDIAGGVTGALGAEAAVAARAPEALVRFAPHIANALYGGLYGYNTAQEGEGLQGAALGAGAGLAGGYLGERGAQALGSVVRGVSDPAVQYLRSRGVPLTVGQTVANAGRVGGSVKNLEDALTSIPGVGSIINARRGEGIEAFNRAAFQDAAAPGANVTATGSEGIGQLRAGVGTAYDNALNPAQIDTNDPQFAADMVNLVNSANAIPPVDGAREAAAAALDNRILGGTDPATGMMTGRNFQEAYRGLARTGRERANRDYGYEIGQVMRQGQDALGQALERQNPGAFEGFIDANAANRRLNVLAQAVGRAKNQTDELFTPAQLNMADASSASRLEGQISSAAGNRPFYDLTSAGQEVLPSRLPDSGTATRGLVAAGALGGLSGAGGGAIFGNPEAGGGIGLGTTLLLAAGGSRPAQRVLVDILASRPELARQIGTRVIDNSGIGRWSGAGVLTPLLIGQ